MLRSAPSRLLALAATVAATAGLLLVAPSAPALAASAAPADAPSTAATVGSDLGATAPSIGTDALPRSVASSGARAVPGAISISGQNSFVDAKGVPQDAIALGAAPSVQLWTADGLQQTQFGTGYSFTDLAGGTAYYLKFVDGNNIFAPTWFGDTPLARYAAPISASTTAADITTAVAAAVSGVVTTDSFNHIIQAWYLDRPTNTIYLLSETPRFLVYQNTPYSIAGLPAGEYFVRSVPEPTTYYDQYYNLADRIGDATTLDLKAGDQVGAIDFTDHELQWYVGRVAGVDRYDTSVRTTQLAFEPGIPVLYVANGANWPDALSAGPAAAAYGGALLLTDPNGLPPVVAAEITRLQPERVVVVGSNASITDATYKQIQKLVPAIERIGGRDRYETSRLLVAEAFRAGAYRDVFIATGTNFPDALSVAPIAGRYGEPVLLVDGATSSVDAATATALNAIGAEHAEFVGGYPSISQAYENSFRAGGYTSTVERTAGLNRQFTSAMINEKYPAGITVDQVFLATGTGFADALAGATVAAAYGAPLYLTEHDCIRWVTLSDMIDDRRNHVMLLGGLPSLGQGVQALRSCE